MDCNHWYDPRKPASKALTQKLAAQKIDLTYEVMLNYACMQLIADALERAASADRQKIIEALAASTLSDHIMPYGPTKFVNGNNEGAQPVNTQIRGDDIEVIFPQGVRDGRGRVPDTAPGVTRPQADSSRAGMHELSILAPAMLNGLTVGAVYALVALGLTLIYGVLHIINFAHGSLLMLALYAVFFLKACSASIRIWRSPSWPRRSSASATLSNTASSALRATARSRMCCW